MPESARNVLIIVGLAALVAFLPGGNDTAQFLLAVLSVAILAGMVMFFARMYRENRVAIFSLGDQHRGLLYGALATFVFCMASRVKLLDSGAGSLVWVALMVGVVVAVYRVVRHYREYMI